MKLIVLITAPNFQSVFFVIQIQHEGLPGFQYVGQKKIELYFLVQSWSE